MYCAVCATHYHQVRTFQTKVLQSKGLLSIRCYLTQYPWVLVYRIKLQTDSALDSLDDNLRIPPLRCKVMILRTWFKVFGMRFSITLVLIS